MPFIPYNAREGRPSNQLTITIDKAGRLYLSKALQEELDCVDKPIKLHVGYDPENKRIGLAKPEDVQLEKHSPLSFGGDRAYASARGFLSRFQIPHDKSYKYVYTGTQDGWMSFEREE
jgi:hypothetical protein